MDKRLALRLAAIRSSWRLTASLRELVEADLDDDYPLRRAHDEAVRFIAAAEDTFPAAVTLTVSPSPTDLTDDDAVKDLLGERLHVMLSGHSDRVMNKAVRLVAEGKVKIVGRWSDDMQSATVTGDTGIYQCWTSPEGHHCTCPAGEANKFCSHLLAANLYEASIRLNLFDEAPEGRKDGNE